MRLLLLIYFFLEFFSLSAQSTNTLDSNLKSGIQWHYGYIISYKNDTIYGYLKVGRKLMGYDFQKKIGFKYQSGADSLFTPYRAKAFAYFDTIGSNVKVESYLSLENTMSIVDTTIVKNRRYFFHIVNEGKCKVYGFTGIYNTNGVLLSVLGGAIGGLMTTLSSDEGYCIQRNGSDLYPIKKEGFKKDMCEFFWNCPDILEKLKSKKYTVETWIDMIDDFNKTGCK